METKTARSKKSIVGGVGINDANYVTQKTEVIDEYYPSGRRKTRQVWICPYYRKWTAMLERCYSKSFHEKAPSYRNCFVCEEWLTFSNFSSWMKGQDWKDKHLDKDYLVRGNKMYSPTTCVFLCKIVNDFIKDRVASRGNCLLGCHLDTRDEIFISYCNNPFKRDGDQRKNELGSFDFEVDAHLAWKYAKHTYAVELANSEYVTDDRIKDILLSRYQNYTVVEVHLK
tara:strand:- start:79 stop:759 length:681 start_codon:yes stop_codon:yes gene_type:complete